MQFKDGRETRLGQRGGLHARQEDPNLMQILAAAAVIRMGWSDLERRARWQMSSYRQQSPHRLPKDVAEALSGSG